ncbi:hypothetical protein BDZ91DRAFT_786662, partial [Kalaharituber pfeilii]
MPSESDASPLNISGATPANDNDVAITALDEAACSASASDVAPPSNPSHKDPEPGHAVTTSAPQGPTGTFSSGADLQIFGPLSQQISSIPSTLNSVVVRRQAVTDDVGVVSVKKHPIPERGILSFLVLGQEKALNSSEKSSSSTKDPTQRLGYNGTSGTRRTKILGPQQHRIVFSALAPLAYAAGTHPSPPPADSPPSGPDSIPDVRTESSSSTPATHSRRTPLPTPVLLEELILQQTKDEVQSDGTNDEDLKGTSSGTKKRVRLEEMHTPLSSSPEVSSSNKQLRQAATEVIAPPSSHIYGNKLDKAIKKLLFKKHIKKSRPSPRQISLSSSLTTLSATDIGAQTPCLPQGGRQEIVVSKQLPPLMIGGPDRDFLPSEATYVPTPLDTPILGGPLSVDEALMTIPQPTAAKRSRLSDAEPVSPTTSVVLEHQISREAVLTRPILTQEMSVVAPFFKMGENFPAPPTPPLPKWTPSSSDKTNAEYFKLPKLDTHGILDDYEPGEQFGEGKKSARKISTASTLKTFFTKPFAKRGRRDSVASVTPEWDKESAGVGLRMRDEKGVKRRSSFAVGYHKSPTGVLRPSRSATTSPVLQQKIAGGSMPIVEERGEKMESDEGKTAKAAAADE